MGCTNLGPLWATSKSTSMSSNGGVYGILEVGFLALRTEKSIFTFIPRSIDIAQNEEIL